MALEGSIKDFGLAEILQLIFLQRKDGILSLKARGKYATVFFDKGLIVDVTTSEREAVEKIGEILIRANRINDEQLGDFLKNQEGAHEQLGHMLSESGLIKNEDVKKALNLQKHEIIYSLFRWKEGYYQFDQKPFDLNSEIPPLNTEFILMEGIRRLDEWPFIEKILPSKNLIIKKIPEKEDQITLREQEEEIELDILEDFKPPKEGSGYPLSREEYEIYNMLDGSKDLYTVLKLSPLDDFDTSKAISNFVTTGLVQIVGETVSPFLEEIPKKPKSLPWLSGFNKKIINFGASVIIILSFFIGGYTGYLKYKGNYSSLWVQLKTDQDQKLLENLIHLYFIRYGRYPENLKELKIKKRRHLENVTYEKTKTGFKLKF